MPIWAWIAVSLSGILILFLFLFRVHYRFSWNGGFDWSGTFKYGFPGFTHTLNFPERTPSVPDMEKEIPSVSDSHKTSRPSRPGSGRGKRVLRRLILDPIVWRVLIGYAWRSLRRTFRLLHLELDCAIGHSDPALLGRFAGYWYGAEPLLPTRHVRLHFRFQDQRSTIKANLQGGFSAAQGLAYAFMAFFTFPWITVSCRAWHGWRNS